MLEKGLKKFAIISAIVSFVFVGGFAITGNLSVIANEEAVEDSVTIKVSGMSCGACSSKVKTALEKCEGVIQAEVSHQSGEAVVKFDNSKTDAEKIKEAVKGAGFKASS